MAKVFANLESLPSFAILENGIYGRYAEEVWIINGQELRYGSDTIYIVPNANKLDTILYKSYRDTTFYQIITNIRKPLTFGFNVNTCCSYFNIKLLDSETVLSAEVNIMQEGLSEDEILLTLDEAGCILQQDSLIAIKLCCRSAMKSQVFDLVLEEIRPCKPSTVCNPLPCLYVDSESTPSVYDFTYEVQKRLYNIKLVSMDIAPFFVEYDANLDLILLK